MNYNSEFAADTQSSRFHRPNKHPW